MLEPPRSLWLPLQPLASSSLVGNHHPFNSNFDKRHLPGQSCSIEALRDTLAPLYYSCTQSTSPLDPPAITNATTRDLAAILKLHASTLPLRYDPAFFLSLLLNANYLVLVARLSDKTIVACATAFLHPGLNELELLTLCVDQKYSRNGLASLLLQEIASKALQATQYPTLNAILRVQTSNSPAIKLYTKIGFIIDGIEATYYKGALEGGSAAYRMKKSISK